MSAAPRTMAEVDTLVADALGDDEDDPIVADPPADDRAEQHVCHHIQDGAVCGASFDNLRALSAHTMAKHKVTLDGKPVARRGAGGSTKRQDSAPRRAASKATARTQPIQTHRPDVYAQSITTVALLAHMGAGRYFDAYDLNVVTNGAPALANALDAVGEQNESVRRACDAILAGGTGGAYVQLFMAASMIVAPIAAHHGWLPQVVGQRFGMMAGVAGDMVAEPSPPPPAAQPAEAPSPTGLSTNPADWDLSDWGLAMTQMRPDVMEQMMAAGAGPTVVNIPPMPGTEPMPMRDNEEHRGSVGAEPANNGTSEPVRTP